MPQKGKTCCARKIQPATFLRLTKHLSGLEFTDVNKFLFLLELLKHLNQLGEPKFMNAKREALEFVDHFRNRYSPSMLPMDRFCENVEFLVQNALTGLEKVQGTDRLLLLNVMVLAYESQEIHHQNPHKCEEYLELIEEMWREEKKLAQTVIFEIRGKECGSCK